MAKRDMAPWETDKELVVHRIDELDRKFDKLEARFDALNNTVDTHVGKLYTVINDQRDQIHCLRTDQSKQIDSLKLEIIKLVTENKVDIGLFKKEFRIKTSAWAFLGTAIALAIGVIGYLIKNQLV